MGDVICFNVGVGVTVGVWRVGGRCDIFYVCVCV